MLGNLCVRLACHNKIPQTGWLKQQTCTSVSSGGWKSKSKVPANSVTGEHPLPDLHMSTFLLFLHMVERKGESYGLSSSSQKDTNPIMEPTPSHPHLNLITSQKPHLQILSHGSQDFTIWYKMLRWGTNFHAQKAAFETLKLCTINNSHHLHCHPVAQSNLKFRCQAHHPFLFLFFFFFNFMRLIPSLYPPFLFCPHS